MWLDVDLSQSCSLNILLICRSRELVTRALLLPALVPFFKCEDESSRLGAQSLSHCAGLGEANAGSISLQKEDQVERALRTLEDMLDVILPEQSLLTILAEETVPSLLSLYLFLETAHQNCHLRGAVKRVTLLALRKLSQDLKAILRRLAVQASECSSIEVVDNAFAWRLDQHWAPGPTGGVQLRVDSKVRLGSRVTLARPNVAGGDSTTIAFDVVVKLLKALEEPEAVCQLLLDLMTEYFTLRMAADRDPESEEERSWQKFSPRLLLKLLQNEWTVTVFASNVPKSLKCVCTLLNHVVQRISRQDKDSAAVDPETASFCVSHCLNILLLLSMLPTTMSVRSNYLELRRALPALEYLNGVSEEARANAEAGCLSDDELQVVTALLRAIYTQTQHADDAESKTSTIDMQNSTSSGDGHGQQDKVSSQHDLVLRKKLADMFSEELLQDLDSDQVPLRAYAVNRIRKIVLAAKAATQTPTHTTTTTTTTTTTNPVIASSSISKEQVDPGLAAKLSANLQHIFVLLDKQLKVLEMFCRTEKVCVIIPHCLQHSDSFVFTNAVGAIEALSDLNLADTVPVILNTLLDGSNTVRAH